MMKKILVANRGEIARRVMRTCRRLHIATVAVYSSPDSDAPHVRDADEAFALGGETSAESYLCADKIIDIALRCGADAIHPGYGFLSENPVFVEAVTAAGLTFVGPGAAAMRALGHKHSARAIAQRAGVPVVPGYQGDEQSTKALREAAQQIGFPLLIKAAAGGGGKGMRRVDGLEELDDALVAAKREAQSFFSDERLIIEKVIDPARHVEVQVVADRHGNIRHLFERDCSLQRRHQKIVEETPAPGLPTDFLERLYAAAIAVAREANLESATTMEFLVGGDAEFYFLEANCRIQVEHPVTEMVTGVDLVELQVRIARGEALNIPQSEIVRRGCAVEARVYAEVAASGFIPKAGILTGLELPAEREGRLRIEHALTPELAITTNYDPLLAKVIAAGSSRDEALETLCGALEEFYLTGVDHNIPFLLSLLRDDAVRREAPRTSLVQDRLAHLIGDERGQTLAQVAVAAALVGEVFHRPADDVFATETFWRGSGYGTLARPEMPLDVSCPAIAKSYPVNAAITRWENRRHGASCSLRIDGSEFECSVERGGRWLLLGIGDIEYRVLITASLPGIASMSFCGYTFYVRHQQVKRLHGIQNGAVDAERIVSPLPGTLLELRAAVGDRVESGSVLAAIESMKMEHLIIAPAEGTVEELYVEAGSSLGEGQEILRLKLLVK